MSPPKPVDIDNFYMSISSSVEHEHKAALCACRLVREELGRVKLYHCPLHAQAPALRQAAQYARDTLRYGQSRALITAPAYYQIQIQESLTLLDTALAQIDEERP